MENSANKPTIKIISPTLHGVLDYLVVLFLLIAPSVFSGMGSTLTTVVYALAVVHLALTVSTRSPVGLFHVVSLRIHAFIELMVAIGLVASPWILNFADAVFSRNFVIMLGALIFLVWLLSDFGISYKDSNATETKDEEEGGDPTTDENKKENSKENDVDKDPSDHA